MKKFAINFLKRKKILQEKGFSLLELLITLGIFAILMVTITRIIVINLEVARRIKARNYVREETSFMLNVLKKDIRNAESISTVPGTNDTLDLVVIVPNPAGGSGLIKNFRWEFSSGRIKRSEVVGASMSTNYWTPSDIDFSAFTLPAGGTKEMFDIKDSGLKNKIVIISIEARTIGMPEGQTIKKEVAVSTRNFEF